MRTREHAAARPERLPESERFERKQEVVDAVYALDEPMRTMLIERYLEGLAACDVAKRHGVTAATVRNRIHSALAQLRAEFQRRHGTAWSAFFLPLAYPGKAELAAASVITGGLVVKGKLILAGLVVAGTTIVMAISSGTDDDTNSRSVARATPAAQLANATGADDAATMALQ